MWFFLPRRLIEFDYLGGESEPEYTELAKPYQKDIDFAFFAANFGYSRSDYDALTLREKALIYKAWEERIVSATYRMYNAVYTATYNVNRPKRKRALKLFKKASTRKANMETVHEDMKLIKEVENKEGKSWIDLIYRASGLNNLGRRKEMT